MPNLLQINVCASVESTGKIAEDIGCLAIEAGWNSWIAYGRKSGKSKSKLIKVGNSLSVYGHYIESRFLDNEGLSSRLSTISLINKIKSIFPDVIIIHNIHDHWLNYKILFEYLNSTQIPIIWVLHDCWPFTGHCAHFADISCNKWQTLCEDCPKIMSLSIDNSRRNFNLKRKYIASNNNITFVTVSDWLKDLLLKSMYKKLNIHCIYNGIDIDVFKPKVNGLKEKLGLKEKFVILVTGTVWLPYKGINDYAKLRDLLSDEYAIVFVGVSERYLLTIPKNIICIKKTNSSVELSEYYSMADCVMSLSRLETFGLTIVEGFACGTPGIVYNSTALPELITGETGYVIEVGNIEGIKKAVETIKRRSKSSYSKACRKRAVEFYNKQSRYAEYIDLINSKIIK